ncbi:hypothetical protein BDV39DRAFT_182387 [Aspergillus sergii]|uniref:Secreted protein n=1 Tax=Aspergillus sergii TaxID=1034303 RepID=A0A5N6WVC5_9EURO|nr:hypothetical protein BDV39DRAFT_182387 [Aspergillus sergii]
MTSMLGKLCLMVLSKIPAECLATRGVQALEPVRIQGLTPQLHEAVFKARPTGWETRQWTGRTSPGICGVGRSGRTNSNFQWAVVHKFLRRNISNRCRRLERP